MEEQEIISKLKHTHELTLKIHELKNYIDNGGVSEAAEETKTNTNNLGSLSGVPSVFKNLPEFVDLKSEEIAQLLEEKEKSFKPFKITLIVAAALTVLYFVTSWDFLATVTAVSLFVLFFVGSKYSSKNNKYKKEYEIHCKNKDKYLNSIERYKKALLNFEKEKEFGIQKAKEFSVEYKRAYEKQNEIFQNMMEKQAAAVEEHNKVIKELQDIDIISVEYYHLIPRIVQILETNRADDLKEALNLAIEDKRAEEREAALIAEEQRRTQMLQLEQQRMQEEQRRHNQELEVQARVQSKMMMVEQDRQRAAERQAERDRRDASHAQERARRDALHRCGRCANYNACGSARGQINCGAFVPRNRY